MGRKIDNPEIVDLPPVLDRLIGNSRGLFYNAVTGTTRYGTKLVVGSVKAGLKGAYEGLMQ